jgi:hypothetical protein
MTAPVMIDLLVALRSLEPVIRRARAAVQAGPIAEHLVALEGVRIDTIAAIKLEATPRIGTNLGDLLAERRRFADGGQLTTNNGQASR